MKKSVFIFMFVFIFSVFLTLPVKAELVTSDYRTVLDSGENSLIMKETEGSAVKIVFIENINLMYYLALDVSCSYYVMSYPTADIGKEVTFYDGYLIKANSFNTSTTLYTNNLDGQHALPYAINYYRASCAGAISVNPDATYATCADFVAALEEAENLPNYFKNITPDNDDTTDSDSNKLPCLTYSASKKWYAKLANDFLRYNLVINWNYKEKEPYTSNPDDYKVQIIAFLNGSNSDYQKFSDSSTWFWVTQGYTCASNSYSFSLEDTVNNIRDKFAFPVLDENLTLLVYYRTFNPASGAVSDWRGVNVLDPCGAPNLKPIVYPDGYDGTSDNIDTSGDATDIDNGGYTQGTEDTSKTDPGSYNYVDPADIDGVESFISNIKTISGALGSIPSLIADVYSWFPSDLIILISSSIGLIVLVGVIKWCL